MFSVMYTGMNFFPLCTASVCPTISGITVDRRDQVLMTFRSVPRFITSTFSRSKVSTNGPFFSDLLISALQVLLQASGSSLLLSALHDELVGRLPVPRLVSLGRQPPRRHGMTSARGLALAAAQRVIHRVHRDAAHMRSLAKPAAPAGLADRHVFVIEIPDLANRRVALDVDLANLARRHAHRGVVAFLGHQLHGRSSAARD